MMKSFEALGKVYTQCCATCKHWGKITKLEVENTSAHGDCAINTYPNSGALWTPMLTLDLSLCSKWQEKDTEE